MIIGKEFVWLHFPKCAGTKIEKIFETYFSDRNDLHLDPVGLANDPTVGWHDSIEERERKDPNFKLGDRDVVVSVRRLPSWLVSRYCFEVNRSPDLMHDASSLLKGQFLEANGYLNHADYYMSKYIPKEILEGRKNNIIFLRTEFFEEDFKSIFSKYLNVSAIPDDVFSTRVNVSEDCLPSDFIRQLHSHDFSQIAPYWSKIESMAYK